MGVDSVSSSGYNSNPLKDDKENWGKGQVPPGKPLPPDDPWCKSLRTLFPNLPETQIQEYASRFRDNMFNSIQDQIKHDAKKAKEASDRLKRVAQGEA